MTVHHSNFELAIEQTCRMEPPLRVWRRNIFEEVDDAWYDSQG